METHQIMRNLATIKVLAIILLFNSCASVTTNEQIAQQEARRIANNYFTKRINQYKKRTSRKINPYYLFKSEDSIFSNFLNDNERVVFLKSYILSNKILDTIEANYIFNKKNVKSYKKQLNNFELDVVPKELLNDMIIKFPYRVTKKNMSAFYKEKRHEENKCMIDMSSPVFTKNGKYALFFYVFGDTYIHIYKYHKKWELYKSSFFPYNISVNLMSGKPIKKE